MLLADWHHRLRGDPSDSCARTLLIAKEGLSEPLCTDDCLSSTVDHRSSAIQALSHRVFLTCSRSFFESGSLSSSRLPLPSWSAQSQAYRAGTSLAMSAFPTWHTAWLTGPAYVNGYIEFTDASLVLQGWCIRDHAAATHGKLEEHFPPAGQ